MTKPIPPQPDGLNRFGNGRGMQKVTRPITKHRGASVTDEGKHKRAMHARSATDTSTKHGAALVPVDKPLTEKQRNFVKFWAQGETILSASVRAGYSDGGTYAYRMVYMPNVLRLYDQEKKLYEESCQMTRKRVMEGLLEGVEMAKLMAEPSAMIAGWREIGKMCGYYEPVTKRIDLNVTGNVTMQRLERLSDAELLKLITETVTEPTENEDEDED